MSLRLPFEALHYRLEKEKKTEHATQEKYSLAAWTQLKQAIQHEVSKLQNINDHR